MSTVTQIVSRALRKCNIRDPGSTRIDEGMQALNAMLQSWEEILHYAPTEESFTLTAGTESYTIGSGGDFDTIRPTKIKSAFIRDSDDNDHHVDVDLSKEDYDRISDKDASGRPTRLYYAPENTLGIIYFNSAPESAEDLYITSYKPFTAYTSVDDTINEPVEYEKAMVYCLAVDLADEYSIALSQVVVSQAQILKNSLAIRNSFPKPEARFDNALLR